MGIKREVILSVKNREDLITNLDIALITNGARIGKGHYRVTLERLSATEVEQAQTEDDGS